jgi:hypothetical protein
MHGRDQSAPMPTASSPTKADGPANLLALAKVADMAFDRIQGLQQNRSRSSRTAAAPGGLSQRGGRPLPPVSPKVATRPLASIVRHRIKPSSKRYARISTFTSIPRKSPGLPMKLPFSGTAWDGSRVTATRMRLRSLTSPLVGSNGTHPAPGR